MIQPSTMHNSYVIYNLIYKGSVIFTWYCKFIELLKIKDAVKNPAFDITLTYNLEIVEFCATLHIASNQVARILDGKTWPPLNMTQSYNRIGMIKCEQTGEIFRSQADIVRRYGVNPGQLAQHLKRALGFASIKGMTFTRVAYLDEKRQPVRLMAEASKPPVKIGKAVRCNETGQPFKSQSQAADWLGINKAQLSQHLRGTPGYKTVKGMTFSHIEREPVATPYRVEYPARQPG
jgi:hypothetical protein